MEYEFTFKLAATDDVNRLVERLGAEGCTDALIGIGRPGWIILDFTREAESREQAIVSAIEDVKRAVLQ